MTVKTWWNGSNTSQYWSFSQLYVHIMISVAKPLRSQGHTMLLTATELYTVIPVRQLGGLKQTPPLSRTNWSFNYWGLSLCVCCIWIHILGFNSQMNKTFDCERLRYFENACELCIFPVCVLPSLCCRTKFCKRVKKKKTTKKVCEKEKECEHDWFCWLASHNCFTVSEEEQLMPVLSSMSQCAWIFLKILS